MDSRSLRYLWLEFERDAKNLLDLSTQFNDDFPEFLKEKSQPTVKNVYECKRHFIICDIALTINVQVSMIIVLNFKRHLENSKSAHTLNLFEPLYHHCGSVVSNHNYLKRSKNVCKQTELYTLGKTSLQLKFTGNPIFI